MTTPLDGMADAVVRLSRAIRACHARVDGLEIVLPAEDFRILSCALESGADLIQDANLAGRDEFRIYGVLFRPRQLTTPQSSRS